MVQELEYPLHLGLAYLFLVGYLARTAFLAVRLPGAVGVIVSGFVFSNFIQTDILGGRDHLQGLAFFLVLLTAGFEISLADLRPYILVFAILPATLELVGIAAYSVYFMGYTPVEGLILGTTLFCLGDGLVIPKMSEMGKQFPGHPMPRLVFTWAPLEASYALTLFGVLAGLADPANQASVSLGVLVGANLLRTGATLAFGALIGAAAGWLIPMRTNATSFGRPVFCGTGVEAYLMILSVALAAFGLGAAEGGVVLLPMGFCPGSVFQPELLVIVIGAFFAHFSDHSFLEQLETIVGGVWVFGQLILFSMLGSKTDVSVFAQFVAVVPLMIVGLSLRFLGVLLATFATLRCRPCACEDCLKANTASAMLDAGFCFLSTLPRATIQGALGPVPITQRFFRHDSSRAHVQLFISMAARLYIVCMAIVGSILLDTVGHWMLQASQKEGRAERCFRNKTSEVEYFESGWTEKERRFSAARRDEMKRLISKMQQQEDPMLAPRLSVASKRPSVATRRLSISSFDGLGGIGSARNSTVLPAVPRSALKADADLTVDEDGMPLKTRKKRGNVAFDREDLLKLLDPEEVLAQAADLREDEETMRPRMSSASAFSSFDGLMGRRRTSSAFSRGMLSMGRTRSSSASSRCGTLHQFESPESVAEVVEPIEGEEWYGSENESEEFSGGMDSDGIEDASAPLVSGQPLPGVAIARAGFDDFGPL